MFLGEMVKYASGPLSNLEKSNAIAVLQYFNLEHPVEGVQHLLKESQDLGQSAARLKSRGGHAREKVSTIFAWSLHKSPDTRKV